MLLLYQFFFIQIKKLELIDGKSCACHVMVLCMYVVAPFFKSREYE